MKDSDSHPDRSDSNQVNDSVPNDQPNVDSDRSLENDIPMQKKSESKGDSNAKPADGNTGGWEVALDLVVERWEVLFENGNELSVEALCENDDELLDLAKRYPGLVEAAEAEVDKLRRFQNAFGDLIETPTMNVGQFANGFPSGPSLDSNREFDSQSPTDREQGRESLGDRSAEGREEGKSRSGELTSFHGAVDPHKLLGNPSSQSNQSAPNSEPSSERPRLDRSDRKIRSGTGLEVDGHMTIESHLDQGGLGDIYRAADESLNRPVAVKLIKDYYKNRHYKSRFLREAAVTAQLDGPGVVPIHGCGTAADGQPFYVMRLIDGDGLDEKIKQFHVERTAKGAKQRDSIEFQRLLRYFLSVCRTVTYAHDMGVVHCDLKPQNIKIGRYEEVFVLDWGEATSCGSRLDVPKHHSGRVSPAYAPPELLTGSKAPTPATDIFSLGVILYEILLGRKAADDAPGDRENRLKSAHVPPALASICRKGLQVAREARYQSVRDMTADIERWMADERVEVHRYSLRERFSLSLRRYTTLAQIAGIAVTALLLLSLVLAARLQFKNAQQEQTHVRTLMVSAGLSSDRIADELHRRFVFLDTLGREVKKDQTLVEAVNAGVPPQQAGEIRDSSLMNWLNQRLNETGTPAADSWFILDDDGFQIAKRVPLDEDPNDVLASLGKYYGYRDYFHGQGFDLENHDPTPEGVDPISEPYLCRRYTSSTTQKLRVALTCPLKDEQGSIIGVIGMSFNLDELSFVSNRLNEEESLVLVDTRASAEKHVPGAIVVHPRYRASLMDGFEVDHQQLSDDNLELFRDVQDRRRIQYENRINQDRLPSVDNHLAHFKDPVEKGNRRMHAAFEPVFVDYRGKLIETGLVVLVRGQDN